MQGWQALLARLVAIWYQVRTYLQALEEYEDGLDEQDEDDDAEEETQEQEQEQEQEQREEEPAKEHNGHEATPANGTVALNGGFSSTTPEQAEAAAAAAAAAMQSPRAVTRLAQRIVAEGEPAAAEPARRARQRPSQGPRRPKRPRAEPEVRLCFLLCGTGYH
jgi:outer membrane biosynthesis protein TonB